jgi:endonuclease III
MYPSLMDKKLKKIFDYIKELFPNPETELHYSTPFQLVVAVMLSAQATDKQVNKVTERLFQKVKNPDDVVSLWFKTFEKTISSVNYYKSKAKHIFETAKLLHKRKIPDTLEELMKLPGIGIKTAKLIAHVLYAKPFIAVDTHIHRVANRLWLVTTTAPEKTSELLENLIPDSAKDIAHHGLVLFGRYHCLARNPKCDICKLKNICLYYKTNHD